MSIVDNAKQAMQGAIFGAMKKAAALTPGKWLPGGKPDPLIRLKRGLIGAPVSRIDGPLKVQGKATFAGEVELDHLAYAAIAFSTIANGRIGELDTAAAEAAPGVVLVMTYHNAPRMQPMPQFLVSAKGAGGDSLPIMQDEYVHWNGQPIALVLAETQEQADHAKTLIGVTYVGEPAATEFENAKTNGTEQGMALNQALKLHIGDADAALAAASTSIDVTYRTPYQNHNAIELHAATVLWKGDELIVHDATQLVAHTAWSLAQIFAIDEKQVRVTSQYVGGGFGGKGLGQHQALAAAAAKLTGRPVRIMLSREGVFRIVGGRPVTEQRVAIGADPSGHIEAIIHTGTSATTRANSLSESFIDQTRINYAAGSFKLDVQLAFLNMAANTNMRAP